MQSLTPACTHTGLGSSGFARRYSRNRCFLLFLSLLRCFSSGGSPPYVMYWRMDTTYVVGFPIQISPDQWIFAPPRSFSQLITSFIGSQCQGIHPALFFVWPSHTHAFAYGSLRYFHISQFNVFTLYFDSLPYKDNSSDVSFFPI